MQSVGTSLDRLVGRALFVTPKAASADVEKETQTAERAFGLSLLFSGVRCILQYVVLPFILPALGVAANVTVPLLIGITLVAIVALIFSLRRFWAVGYEYRWQYLLVSVVALILMFAFLALDFQQLGGA